MDAATALATIADKGWIVDIGQIDEATRRVLRKEVAAGRIERVKAPLWGLLLDKTHYVADRERFDRDQHEGRARLTLAAALDESARAARSRAMAEAA